MAKKSKRSGISLYANLITKRRSKVDARARRKAEYLATLPKNPIKRVLYRIHPRRVMKFWFSRDGLKLFLKLLAIGVVIIGIFVAALFAYYRRELDSIRPDQLAQKVQTTVATYTDRNGTVLWEDKGDGDYKQVIDSKDIPKVMKDATVAIEDKDFYKHGGISVTGILRAGLNNLFGGGDTQGASTLTQQLIKNVFFYQDASTNRLNVSRKIKEIILSVEVERMYNKDQILTLYLNEVPYGGPRNGVESAALSYFGKHTKDLNIAEAALLASIPQNPTYYNPYALTPQSSKDLIERQQYVIDLMKDQGYISDADAKTAKAYPILDSIKPEQSGMAGIKAPHFVLEVRAQLEKEFGVKLIRDGGLTVKTTLDYRVQQIAEQAVADNRKTITSNGSDTTAVTSIDVPTGQVLAQVGSADFTDPSIDGEFNAATHDKEPGSSIKPFIYANLFKQHQGTNYGAGSILTDTNIDSLYCKGNLSGSCKLNNFDFKFFGPLPIRETLSNSRNPPAVEAMFLGGPEDAIQTAKDAGEINYCNGTAYLSAAIGSGCAVHVDQHANAFATLARQGVYKPVAYVLEVKNAQGQTLKQWKDDSKRVLDPQITYILSDILSDAKARSRVFGTNTPGMTIPGVRTATKTGTTDDGQNHAKDGWMMSFTPRMATGVWVGRHDGKGLRTASNLATGNIIKAIMERSHKEIFAKDGSWKEGDWFSRPSGVQDVTVNGKSDIYPSWYTKPTNAQGESMDFDSVSKKKATACTPSRAKVSLNVQVFVDPLSNAKTYTAPDGYDANNDDDVHKCDDVKPFVSVAQQHQSGNNYKLTATVSAGTHPLSSVQIAVDGTVVSDQAVGAAGDYSVVTQLTPGSHTISATVIDQALYDATDSEGPFVVFINTSPPIVLGRHRG